MSCVCVCFFALFYLTIAIKRVEDAHCISLIISPFFTQTLSSTRFIRGNHLSLNTAISFSLSRAHMTFQINKSYVSAMLFIKKYKMKDAFTRHALAHSVDGSFILQVGPIIFTYIHSQSGWNDVSKFNRIVNVLFICYA